ncbi:zinc finger CCHC domain-containing protein 10 [Drosophila grimshawi]|uniref:zinc finger CCHC domain-containing protein 10 n=1 Tax=Drosophila grimshawi TaxID=7222 RepID=UPI000C86F918|nr:zinc finger CCHC domain-containing protein 10 [Drosophila grimshawi]
MTLVGLAARKLAQKQRTAKLAAAFPNGIRCQKCLNLGHWSYECKEKRKYVHRSSRTKQLSKHLAEKSANAVAADSMSAANEMRSLDAGSEVRHDGDKEKRAKRKRKRSNSSSSSSSSDSSNSSSDSSNSESSSSGDSDSSSSDDDDDSSSAGGSGSSSDSSDSDGNSTTSSDSADEPEISSPKKKKRRDSSAESSDA